MNRKFFIFIIILLLLASGGVFWWWSTKEKEPEDGETIWEIEYVGGYEIKDTSEGKIVENKEYGLVVTVPEGWTVKNYDKEGIGIFSLEVEFDERGAFLNSAREKGGCIIGIEIKECKKVDPELTTDAEDLRMLIANIQENSTELDDEKTRYEVIVINDKKALKTSYLKEGEEKYTTVEVSVDNIVYSFNNGIIFAEKCIQEFDKFLETVSINK